MQIQYHLIDAIFYFIGLVIPVYFVLKARDKKIRNDPLVKLMILLSIFMLIQLIYHILGNIGLRLIAKGIFEPVSASTLLIFGIFYFFSYKKIKDGENFVKYDSNN